MRLTKKRADNGRCYLSGLSEVSNIYSKGYGRIQIGDAVEKLAEYEDLEEQNRLLKLPCAVGDTVYCIVTSIKGTNPTIFSKKFDYGMIESLGKAVFLTREETEAALEELERGKGE